MKLNEKFTKEEIAYFEKLLTKLVLKEEEYYLFCKRLKFFRHYNLVKFLDDEFRMPTGTALRFINYFSLSPLYMSYSQEEFKIDNSKVFIRSMWNDASYFSEVEKKIIIEQAFNKNVVVSRGDDDSRIKAKIKKQKLFSPLFVIDTNDLFWPTTILKTI